MYTMVKLAEIQSRAPNREILVSISVREKTNGNRKTQLVKSIDAIESLRPNLSTTMADISDPGISAKLDMKTFLYRLALFECTDSTSCFAHILFPLLSSDVRRTIP